METIGKLLHRTATLLVMVVMTVMVAAPSGGTVSAAAAVINDSFNICTLNSAWDDETGAHANPVITGAYRGNAALSLAVAPGVQSTISGANQNASRVMQQADDQSFELEVRFNSALGLTDSASRFRMQGILVRDNTDPENPKWLRFDFNTDDETINFYAGYTNENQVTQHFTGNGGGVSTINTQDANAAGGKIRIKYEQPEQRWSMRYWLPVRGWSTYQAFSFTETAPTYGSPFTFTVTDIGVFSGSTGPNPTGHTAQVDYFYMSPQAENFNDDAITLTVNTNGSGSVNWPAGAVCSGNQVTLTATPNPGADFDGWSGDLISTEAQIQLNMTRSYNLLANFGAGVPVEQPYSSYLPYIRR